jgi:phospholipid/cholesterol/gamma-HCH transport system substrate-binding protein
MPRPFLNRAFAVGLLVAVTGIAFLVAFTFFKKGGFSERDSYKVFAFFDDVTGLTWKSRVQIAGIQVGEVDQVTLVGTRARLDLRIKKDIDFHTDACLTKRFPSALLPDALLEATAGTPQTPSLRDLPPEQREITCVREAASVQKLLDSLSKITADVQIITRDLTQTIGGAQGSIREIVERLSQVARNIDRTVSENGDKLSAILDNAQAFTGELRGIAEQDREKYHQIAKNVAEASERLNSVLASVQSIIGTSKQPELKESYQGLKNAVDKANASLAHVEEVTKKVAEGKSVAGKLLTDERLGEKFGNAVEGVSDYIDRLVKLQVKLELRSEWLLQQSGSKTYFGIKILPRPDKFYLIQILSDPRGVNTVTNETVDTVNKNTGAEVVTQTTRTVNQQQLSFSAEFGKRYGPVTFRIGVIESSGGVGADLSLMKERLQLSVDLYQFTRPTQDVFPRAKIWANYYFLDHFYLTTGADDFLNQWRAGRYPGGPKFAVGRDVFFGAGLFFTDDDIKTLFGAGFGSAAATGAAAH